MTTYAGSYNKDRHFTLLVIDDCNTEWGSYLRGKKLHKDWDLRVEQADFQDISLSAASSTGVVVTLREDRAGIRPPRSFKPDFVLIRQNLRDATEDHKNLLLGFQFGGIPSLNSLASVYNFQDKPWVYAHLRDIQRKLGKERFPLIEQQYFPDHRDMNQNHRCQFPCVFKVGHAHGGLGKVKVETESAYQDIASVVAVSGQYVTVESYVEAKHDLHIFKIGDFYRAITCSHCCDCRRPSVSGNWKTTTGQTVIEEVPVLDRYKLWIDKVSEMFGGLDICSLEAVVGKDDTEHIIEVNDCAMKLLGDTAEEDRQLIAQMVMQRMEEICKPVDSNGVKKSDTINAGIAESLGEKQGNICRTDSRESSVSSMSVTSEGSSSTRRGDSDTTLEDKQGQGPAEEHGEDTMKNLRSSFAGLFGSDLK